MHIMYVALYPITMVMDSMGLRKEGMQYHNWMLWPLMKTNYLKYSA